MSSQSSLMVAAHIRRDVLKALRLLLTSMNQAPGRADPANALVPFGHLENLHYGRFLILDDQTVDDVRLYDLPSRNYPIYLTFLCDFDGSRQRFLDDLLRCATPGLKRIFGMCEDFKEGTDLRLWIESHNIPIAATYINWRGRTVKQVREEVQLRQKISSYVRSHPDLMKSQDPQEIRTKLRDFVQEEPSAARLVLTPLRPAPVPEMLEDFAHFVSVGLLLLLLFPLIALLVVFHIHPMEESDPVFAPKPDERAAADLARIEDHEVTNQFSAMGSLKPGLARQWLMRYILCAINWAARHWFNTGRLARVRSIQFARWVFLDGGRRVLFCSNYDGSLESYMDDFINKVPFGLNLSFSNGIGYPSTRWLVADGASDEQKFKYYLRRHQLPTEVWYDSHPDVTAIELERNSRIHQGLQAKSLSDNEAREWVSLL